MIYKCSFVWILFEYNSETNKKQYYLYYNIVYLFEFYLTIIMKVMTTLMIYVVH